eukprot:m.1284598 g.1284598  ORF g.1284598 m.1284598 type:complete len:367 (-) comp24778_c0_seq42:3250-4350(-)
MDVHRHDCSGSFQKLSEDTLICILELLDPVSLARAEIAIPSVYHVTKKYDTITWKQHVRNFYGLESLKCDKALHRIPCEDFKSYRDAYRILRYAYGTHAPDDNYANAFTPSFFCRARRAWRKIEHCVPPVVRETFLPGASDDDMTDQFIQPQALRAIYSIWNGQQLQFDEDVRRHRHVAVHRSIFHGLFGGYTVYDHCINTRLYPVEWVLWVSMQHWHNPDSGVRDTELVFAASFNGRKHFTIDRGTGDVSIVRSPYCQVSAAPKSATGDGILEWFEEFANRLEAKMYTYVLAPARVAPGEGMDGAGIRGKASRKNKLMNRLQGTMNSHCFCSCLLQMCYEDRLFPYIAGANFHSILAVGHLHPPQ